MIILSKVFFASAAVATLAGSVMLTDATELAREVAATLSGSSPQAEPQPGKPAVATEPAPPSHLQRNCAGSCDLWALLSQLR